MVKDSERRESMGSSMDGTPPRSKDLVEIFLLPFQMSSDGNSTDCL